MTRAKKAWIFFYPHHSITSSKKKNDCEINKAHIVPYLSIFSVIKSMPF